MDGTQAGLSRRRKFDMYVEKAEKMYMKCPLITALRRRLWGVRSRRQPLQSPVTAGLIHAERL
jgi:hypothetical protein